MTNLQLREFYELCQTYRHTPLHEIGAVRSAYDNLVVFVNGLTEESKRVFTDEKLACTEEQRLRRYWEGRFEETKVRLCIAKDALEDCRKWTKGELSTLNVISILDATVAKLNDKTSGEPNVFMDLGENVNDEKRLSDTNELDARKAAETHADSLEHEHNCLRVGCFLAGIRWKETQTEKAREHELFCSAAGPSKNCHICKGFRSKQTGTESKA